MPRPLSRQTGRRPDGIAEFSCSLSHSRRDWAASRLSLRQAGIDRYRIAAAPDSASMAAQLRLAEPLLASRLLTSMDRLFWAVNGCYQLPDSPACGVPLGAYPPVASSHRRCSAAERCCRRCRRRGDKWRIYYSADIRSSFPVFGPPNVRAALEFPARPSRAGQYSC